MKIKAFNHNLNGNITVPGSKSHTIRALLLTTLAEGVSHISNPLKSSDCISTANAIKLIGASVDFGQDKDVWTVNGAGSNIHLPTDTVDVGNSGSLLYFMSPIASTFEGKSVFTGDESIQKRPVSHLTDALNQLGAKAYTNRTDGTDAPPITIEGPISNKNTLVTGGELSQYISGIMMASSRLDGTMNIELTNPKETPYLTMTQNWLESFGIPVTVSEDYKHITVKGPVALKARDITIPSDWEAVAFPLIATLVSDSKIVIENVDGSGTQGDDKIVEILKSVGGDINWNKTDNTLTVCGGKLAENNGRLSTENLPGKELHINLSGFPDAICALAVIACFIEGTTVLEDIEVCRKKETDRVKVLEKELTKLGADIKDTGDALIIKGHSPLKADGSENPEFKIHGGQVESYLDHRVSMSLACMGLGLKEGQEIIVNDAECCVVSFPHFFESMNKIGAEFTEV